MVKSSTTQNKTAGTQSDFSGEKGTRVIINNGEIFLPANVFNDNQARFYNTEIDGKMVYFFVVKDKNGMYRAAASACAVCFNIKKGFHQEGDYLVCNNCGNRYPLEKIATEKGGCNPAPINPNLEVNSNELVIKATDIKTVGGLF